MALGEKRRPSTAWGGGVQGGETIVRGHCPAPHPVLPTATDRIDESPACGVTGDSLHPLFLQEGPPGDPGIIMKRIPLKLSHLGNSSAGFLLLLASL